jgi:hypothetical protein
MAAVNPGWYFDDLLSDSIKPVYFIAYSFACHTVVGDTMYSTNYIGYNGTHNGYAVNYDIVTTTWDSSYTTSILGLPNSVSFDSSGVKNVEWSATGWQTGTTGFWLALDDSANTSVADTNNADTLFYSTDTTDVFTWLTGLWNTGGYAHYLLVVTDGINYLAKYDSVLTPADTTGPSTEQMIPSYYTSGDSTKLYVAQNVGGPTANWADVDSVFVDVFSQAGEFLSDPAIGDGDILSNVTYTDLENDSVMVYTAEMSDSIFGWNIYIKDSLGNETSFWDGNGGDDLSIVIGDQLAPAAGTLAYFNFVPPYNDSLSIDSSLTADALNLVVSARKSAKDSWTVISYLSNQAVDSSFSLSGILSYVGTDTQFVKLEWYDEVENTSTAVLDTILPTGTPNSYVYLGLYDSTHTVLDSFKILINDSAVAATADVFVISAADTVTGIDNDTLMANLPDTLVTHQADTTYIWNKIIFTSGEAPDTSDMATYPARSGTTDDEAAPNLRGSFAMTYTLTDSFTFTPTTLVSDSPDVAYILVVVTEEDGDSLYFIQYNDTASTYIINFTNDPANYSWSNDTLFSYAEAVDDSGNVSAQIKDTLVIEWDWIKAICDTARNTLTWVRVYRNTDDSTLTSPIDSLYQLSIEDIDTTTYAADSIRIAIPEALRYAYFNTKGMFSGNWSESFDAWEYFEEVNAATNFTVTAAGDSDTTTVAATKFGADFIADTARIQYATAGAYPTSRTNGTNVWAGNPSTDSTQINNDNFVLNVTDGDTVWARMYVGHKANDHWNVTTKSDTAKFPELSPPAAGDCTFAWHCESNATITNETPAGYSAGDVVPTMNSGAVITSAQFNDGDSSVSIPTASDRVLFTITSEDIASQDSGTVQFDIRMDDLATSLEYCVLFYVDADNYLKLVGNSSNADELRLTWEGNNTAINLNTLTADIQVDTWYTCTIKWRQGSVDPSLSININGYTLTSTTDLTALTSDPAELWFGQQAGTAHPYWIDNIKVWKYWRP